MSPATSFETLGEWEDYRAYAAIREPEVEILDTRKPTSEVVSLETQIAELQAQLAALQVKKDHLLASQSLILRLPAEILSRIFVLGVHMDLRLLATIHLVSRLWREIAVSSPLLSSYIRLDGGYGQTEAFIRHTKLLLERSYDVRLAVDLDCRFVDESETLEQVGAVLAPHLGRAYAFNISAPDSTWFDTLRQTTASHLGASLEELSLRVDPVDEHSAVTVSQFLCPNHAYERLHTLKLEQVPLSCVAGASMPRLRTLRLSRDTRYHSMHRMTVCLSELLGFLRGQPALEDLTLNSIRLSLDASAAALFDEPERIIMPALSNITFVSVDGPGIGACLTSLNLPLLKRLSLVMDTCENTDMGFLATVLGEGSAASALPSLQALDLRHVNTDGPALFPFVRVLRRLPMLAALGVTSPPSGRIGAQLFDLLSIPSSTGGRESWLLPHLQAMALGGCRDVTGTEVLKAVIARKNAWTTATASLLHAMARSDQLPIGPIDKIQFLRISQCYGLEPDTAEALQDNVDVFRNGF